MAACNPTAICKRHALLDPCLCWAIEKLRDPGGSHPEQNIQEHLEECKTWIKQRLFVGANNCSGSQRPHEVGQGWVPVPASGKYTTGTAAGQEVNIDHSPVRISDASAYMLLIACGAQLAVEVHKVKTQELNQEEM